jgi:hypothetical protein
MRLRKGLRKMTNRYLEKIASDLSIATQSKAEEDKAIQDYQTRLQEAKSPELKDAISHALKEEKDHSERFGKVLEKIASTYTRDSLDREYEEKSTILEANDHLRSRGFKPSLKHSTGDYHKAVSILDKYDSSLSSPSKTKANRRISILAMSTGIAGGVAGGLLGHKYKMPGKIGAVGSIAGLVAGDKLGSRVFYNKSVKARVESELAANKEKHNKYLKSILK